MSFFKNSNLFIRKNIENLNKIFWLIFYTVLLCKFFLIKAEIIFITKMTKQHDIFRKIMMQRNIALILFLFNEEFFEKKFTKIQQSLKYDHFHAMKSISSSINGKWIAPSILISVDSHFSSIGASSEWVSFDESSETMLSFLVS